MAQASPQALDGLKVLDFCWVVAGPMTTKYLAEHGATVVRVESGNRTDVLRNGGPFKGGQSGVNRSGYFANQNANKLGITIDLRHEKAGNLLLRLVRWADLVTENFTPGTMERLGLGYDNLVEVNPEIIMFSTSMLGRGGPFASQPGFGAVMASLSGLTYITGWPDRSPVNPYGAYTDFVAPRFGVAAILAALDYRRRTGKGMHLDLAQLETSLQLSAPLLLDWAMNDRCSSAGRQPESCGVAARCVPVRGRGQVDRHSMPERQPLELPAGGHGQSRMVDDTNRWARWQGESRRRMTWRLI